jgi:hypothetical protein
MKQIELRLVAEEAGFIDRQILEQADQFVFSLGADQQPVITVERVQVALPQSALQTICRKCERRESKNMPHS